MGKENSFRNQNVDLDVIVNQSILKAH